jgi:hypothetical protein
VLAACAGRARANRAAGYTGPIFYYHHDNNNDHKYDHSYDYCFDNNEYDYYNYYDDYENYDDY